DQAKFVELKNLVRGFVLGNLLRERLLHPLSVFPLIHVDEVDDNDSPEIAETDLLDDFLYGLNVGASYRLFQAVPAPDELSGVNVDAHQSFRLIYDDVSAALEPDLRLQELVDLCDDAVLIEDGVALGIELNPVDQVWINLVHKLHYTLIFEL